jgi:transposase
MDTSDQALASDQASVLDQAATRSRRMRTNDEKRRIVEEALAPGASVASVARKHGLNANLLFGWCRLHKRGLLDQCREPASLLPVKVTTPTVLPRHDSGPAKKQTTKLSTPTFTRAASKSHVEIELPGGIAVRVHGRLEPGTLEAVLSALRSR